MFIVAVRDQIAQISSGRTIEETFFFHPGIVVQF
jgi:hypothetical protein